MNLFIIHSIAPEIPITQTYRAVAPFVLSDIIRVGILLGFPSITLGLVRFMF
jgi:TRAP-type C4-dicarboxylate transport system permease large subunit